MSDIVDTINRLEAWVRNYGHQKQPEFIADLKAVIGAAKAALQVAATLENAERIMIMHEDDEIESYAVPSQDVDGAIETLLEGGAAVSEPKLCKWCGAAQSGTDGDDILFECKSWHSGSTPEFQWSQCKLNVAEQRMRRAVDWLQKADRYDLQPLGDYQGEGMVHSSSGDYVDITDVKAAIDILQEGQQ